MSFSFALPAAANAATTGSSGALVGAPGQAAAASDPLGLFGQLLAMMGIDPKAAGELDPKTLAKTLGKAGMTAGDTAGDEDKAKDVTQTDTATPVDLSALIAALLAAAQQTIPAAPTSAAGAAVASSSGDQSVTGVAGGAGKPGSPVQAQLETLMAALAGQTQPVMPGAKSMPTDQATLQAATTIAKFDPALAGPQIDTPALSAPLSATPPVAEVTQAQSPPTAPVAEIAAAATPPDVFAQLQAAAADPKINAAPARPASAAKGASASTAKAQSLTSDAPTLDTAQAPPAEPALEIAKAAPSGKPGPDLSALAGDLAGKSAEKPADDETPSDLIAAAATQALANDAVAPMAAETLVRGSPDTVAKLAAQIVKKLDARTTRFDVALDPIGLGRVDVKVEIGANGKLHAQMSFDNPAAASDLRGRAGQLREALEQAGFDLKGGSLNFDVAGQGGQGRGQQQQHQQGDHPRFAGGAGVFEAALNLGDSPITAPAWAKSGAASGVDIRI